MARTRAGRDAEARPPQAGAADDPPHPDTPGRGALRRGARAERLRALRVRRVSIVIGAVLAVVAVWAITGRTPVTLVPGGASGHGVADGSGSPTVSPTPSAGSSLPSATPSTAPGSPQGSPPVTMAAVSGMGSVVGPTLVPAAVGFARICGRAAPSDHMLVGSVTRTLRGDRAGGTVTIVESQAVYRPGGVGALLAEAARATCADRSDPLPGYPSGSVLLRGRGNTSVAYFVTATSPTTALYIEAASTMEDSVVDALFNVVPSLIADAQAGAAQLAGGMPT